MSMLPDTVKNPEELAESFYDNKSKNNWLMQAIETLNFREKMIIKNRKLFEKAVTLDELGRKLKISKERVRQIETRALNKLKKSILSISQQKKEFFV